jgi:outer membrane protein assembly factor BamE (lipoprotein component of BamABCDE complex)
MKAGRFLPAMFAALVLAGCAASGIRVTDDQLKTMKPGETTEAQAVAAFGKPTMRMRQADGSVLVLYTYVEVSTRPETFIPIVGAFVGGADSRTNTVTLRFGPDGRLMDTSASESQIGTGTGLAAGAPDTRLQQPQK